MSGKALRTVCTTALVAVTALTTIAAPAAADPHDAGPTGTVADKVLGDLGDGVVEALVGGNGQGGAALGGEAGSPVGTAGVLTRLQELYRQAENAETSEDTAVKELRRQRTETARLARDLAEARGALVTHRAAAGRIAREQYQGSSDLSAYLQLLLSRTPEQALDQGHLIERAARGRLAAMSRLAATERRARELAADSRAALDAELVLVARQQKARATATARLRSAEALLATLSPEEVAAIGAAEQAPPLLPDGAAGGTAGDTPAPESEPALPQG